MSFEDYVNSKTIAGDFSQTDEQLRNQYRQQMIARQVEEEHDRLLNEKLDGICAQTKDIVVLNALHACRPGHPLGHSRQVMNFHNAFFVCCGHRDISFSAVDWLRTQLHVVAKADCSSVKS